MEAISINYVDIALRLALSLTVVGIALIAYRLIRNTIKQKIKDAPEDHHDR